MGEGGGVVVLVRIRGTEGVVVHLALPPLGKVRELVVVLGLSLVKSDYYVIRDVQLGL